MQTHTCTHARIPTRTHMRTYLYLYMRVLTHIRMQVDGEPLPGAWMVQMQALVEVHMPNMELPDIVTALKVCDDGAGC